MTGSVGFVSISGQKKGLEAYPLDDEDEEYK